MKNETLIDVKRSNRSTNMKPTQFELDIVYVAQQIIEAHSPWADPQIALDLDDRLTEWQVYNGPDLNLNDPPLHSAVQDDRNGEPEIVIIAGHPFEAPRPE